MIGRNVQRLVHRKKHTSQLLDRAREAQPQQLLENALEVVWSFSRAIEAMRDNKSKPAQAPERDTSEVPSKSKLRPLALAVGAGVGLVAASARVSSLRRAEQSHDASTPTTSETA
jgi:hypothetical protein